MKLMIPLVLSLLTVCALSPSARADDESDKAAAGTKFLETGGRGSVSGGEAVGADSDPSKADRANALVNADGTRLSPDGKEVPSPAAEKAKKFDKAVSAAKGAMYGAVIGGVIGGVAGAIGGPAGVLGGAAAGVKLGAMAGMAIGAGIGWLLGGKSGSGGGAISSRQSQLDAAMKQF